MSLQSKHFSANATNTLVLVSEEPLDIDYIEISNVNAADSFLQLFDVESASDVTLGTTAPTQSFLVPAGDGTKRGALGIGPAATVGFSNGLVYAVTTTADGAVGPATNTVINIGYK